VTFSGEEKLNNSLLKNAFSLFLKAKKNKKNRIYFKFSSPNPPQQGRASERHPAFHAE